MTNLDYDPRTGELTPIVETAAPASAGGEIDLQMLHARQFPRNEVEVVRKIVNLATVDEEAAEECLYALVRKRKRSTRKDEDEDENRPIEGPSIRLAEIAAQKYGNCRIEARVVEINKVEKYVEAEGTFLDLETNMASRARVRRRISTRSGGLFSDDMILVTSNAACAIAKRNAILAGIPRSIYRPAYQAARKMIAGDAQTLASRWDVAVKSFARFGVKPEQILEHFGLESSAEITGDNLVTLRGMYGSLARSEATVEEMFAPAKQEVDKTYDPLGEAAGTVKPKDQPARPSEEYLDQLFADGQAAAKAGAERKAPEEFGEGSELAQAWLNGFDDAASHADQREGE